MVIQQLSVEEGQRFKAIRLRSLADSPDAFGSTFEDNAARSNDGWTQMLMELPVFLAVENGDDVGIVRGFNDPECNEISYLISMWVDPKARRKKIGVALIDAVIEWAKSNGKGQLILDVADYNKSAIALYKGMGFERSGINGTLPHPREHITEHQRILKL